VGGAGARALRAARRALAPAALPHPAAVCGGTQSLHTNGRDEALGLPTEESARLALRTQQVLAAETGIADVADPLGGAWAVEALTGEIVVAARDYVRRIDELGGALAALERGFQQSEIAEAAYAWQQDVEAGRRRVVGVNVHRLEEEPEPEILTLDARAESEQVERLRAFRAARDAERVAGARSRLAEAAAGTANLMEPILDCVRAEATLGETADTLRRVFGEHRETALE
jgi:methylmalonyl-CoA mutase N-terminal domain/subunit